MTKKLQTVYLKSDVVEKPVNGEDHEVDEGAALLFVRKVWDEVTGGQEVADRNQMAKICKVIQPTALSEEVEKYVKIITKEIKNKLFKSQSYFLTV
jgi:hypothetical protein